MEKSVCSSFMSGTCIRETERDRALVGHTLSFEYKNLICQITTVLLF